MAGHEEQAKTFQENHRGSHNLNYGSTRLLPEMRRGVDDEPDSQNTAHDHIHGCSPVDTSHQFLRGSLGWTLSFQGPNESGNQEDQPDDGESLSCGTTKKAQDEARGGETHDAKGYDDIFRTCAHSTHRPRHHL